MDKKKKVLYISNYEVPYRVEFFNQLSRYCNLTVLYESNTSSGRNNEWAKSVKGNYEVRYLNENKVADNYFSFKILKYLKRDYEIIIIGCYNSIVQMFAITVLKILKKKYILNLDGEVFVSEKSIKNFFKKRFINGATHYVIAGKHAAKSLKNIVKKTCITPYPFSSLTALELEENKEKAIMQSKMKNEKTILVIGQYVPEKGLNIAIEAARLLPQYKWKFIGTGSRYKDFIHDSVPIPQNTEIIPFLSKKELAKEYLHCSVMVLPSIQECWGLVINEAASYGVPIVSTYGSGAAVEFLKDSDFKGYLIKPGDYLMLSDAVNRCIEQENKSYSEYLIEKSKGYTIEKCVQAHLVAFNSF